MIFLCLLLAALCSRTNADEQALLTLINRLNSDVIEFRNEVELQHSKRCDAILGCSHASYDECLSELSLGQSCPSKDTLGYAVQECGAGENCNGLFDFTSTTVRLPNVTLVDPNGDRTPRNPNVIEAICSSRRAEEWMVNKYEEDKAYWETIGVASPQMYIGSATGMLRIFPARASRECGSYDPRERPWYKGAVPNTISSAAPRHVVFLLDKSLSMGELMGTGNSTITKLDYMKRIVTHTLRFLTDNDSVAVVTFAENARVRGVIGLEPPFYWKPANSSNIEQLINEVNALIPSGRSNWIEGFDKAFDLIRRSLSRNAYKPNDECKVENVALLFYSDGDMNLPAGITDAEVTQYVVSRIQGIEGINDEGADLQIYPFLYSIGNPDPRQTAKQISCAASGIWKPITHEMAIQNVTLGYETLFSVPLGDEAHQNFTTWSDPYIFASSQEVGYTVSALLYDRSISPPRFIGAVGIDFLISAAMEVYEASEEDTIKAVKRLTSYIAESNFEFTCEQQEIDLTYCDLQSLRHFSGGDESVCIPDQLQNAEGGLDFMKLEAYLLEQNVTEAYTAKTELAEAELAGLKTTNVTMVNVTVRNETITIAAELNETEANNISIETPTIAAAPADPAYAPVQSLSALSAHSVLVNLNCSNAFSLPCPGMDEYPNNLWNNLELKGKAFEDRTCCLVGTNEASDQCPKLDEIETFGLSQKQIFALIIVPLLVIELCGCYFCFIRKRMKDDEHERH